MESIDRDFVLEEVELPELLTSGNSEFFWKADSPFSQWAKAEFERDGIRFNCAEQYMMYEKAMYFGDLKRAQAILDSEDPSEQKQLGREVEGFDEDEWLEVCDEIVYAGNLAKFSQNEESREALIATGNKIIVEINPKDKIWAIGLGYKDSRINTPKEWEGENRLGRVLMVVRAELS